MHITTVASAANALRAKGLRVSATRRALLEALVAADRPVSAEELAEGAALGSVYRNLEALEDAGLVHHVHPGQGPRVYALTQRDYAYCESCRELIALTQHEVDATRGAVREATGFEPSFAHYPLAGRCPRCRAYTRPVRDEF